MPERVSVHLPHDSAPTHVTGQSEFIDDRPPLPGELHVEVVASPHAHATLVNIDARAALKDPDVVAVFTARDLHHNLWGSIFKDQPLLAENEVHYVGEAVAIIAARTREAARRARTRIKVHYEPLPALLSVAEARRAGAFMGVERKVERGDVDAALARAPHRSVSILEGHLTLRGADHFYLESQASIAYPREGGQIEVHSSTQHPTETQHVVAHALGLEYKDVVCVVKRMGGAFGGKESQAAPFAAYAALVAQKTGQPARVVLCKDDDMVMTGKRNPFEIDYRVGFDGDGRVLALDAQLFSDGGAYADLSTAIMERAILHCDNAYFIPHFRARGRVCRTHFHPHTAFRGFGGPKGVALIERVIEEVAHRVKKDPLEVRKLNVYRPGDGRDVTPYGQKVENNRLPELFEKLEATSNYRARRAEIQSHNARALRASSGGAPHVLRGLSLTAVKFGISFTTRFLNQANAFVIVHRDGSVQVSTGATEMGQGVNARIAELVASELGLPRARVRLTPTSTDKNANTSPTAASSGTDLNGAAALLATRKIKARLSELAAHLAKTPESHWATKTAAIGSQPEIQLVGATPGPATDTNNPNADADWDTGIATYHGIRFEGGRVHLTASRSISFAELVHEAYHQRVSLSDYAHYCFDGLSFNKETGTGQAFLYYTQGAAAAEVTVDLDTGEVKVPRVDLLMDLGRPINAGLDLGQVTGGFVQGMGWMTTEKLFYDARGALLTHAPSTYKIPSIQDTPRVFNVDLLENLENRANVRGTKAAGEPPLLLSLCVWTAIHDALSVLPDYKDRYPDLEVPATQEQVLHAAYPDRFAAAKRM